MKLLVTLFLLLFTIVFQSQESLYMPREFKKAYLNKTRSYTGKPGENYWQNKIVYHIDVEVVPNSWNIVGKQKVLYTNNSADSLYSVYIKMHPNHYKKGALRANQIPLENLTDGMQITELLVDGIPVEIQNPNKSSNLAPENIDKSILSSKITTTEGATYVRLNLNNPILPQSTIMLSINWKTQMPSVYVNRMGAYDANSAFVGYWYPQIAVYDDIDGWDDSEYTGAQEYYTDFSDYEVNITAPSSYHIAATGNLLNPEDVLDKNTLLQYKSAKISEDVVTILEGGVATNSKKDQKIWKFKASNVRDFAFGLSNNFKWISQSVNLTSKQVSSNLFYDVKDEQYAKRVFEIQKKSLMYLSEQFPGIPYPYDRFTTYMGVPEFDGMEFPMMANNGLSKEEKSNTYMTFHETSHTFFPHLVGVNEIKYSWMEEGWATFFTIKFIQDLYKNTSDENRQLKNTMRGYLTNAGMLWESPLIAPTNHLTIRKGHFQLSYRKPAFMLMALEDMLGDSIFKRCLKTYIENWKGKHPTPYDFMFTFNNVSKQNLNWFWKKWVFEYGYAEVALKEIKQGSLIIENIGGLPVPLNLKLIYVDGSSKMIKKTSEIWYKNPKKVRVQLMDVDKLYAIELLSDTFPDINKENNTTLKK